MNKKCFFFLFYILCENFSKIGPIIKKIPNFVNDPLKYRKTTKKKKLVYKGLTVDNNSMVIFTVNPDVTYQIFAKSDIYQI